MAKKLQPDVIEWILKLNSTQAQEEYHKLEKANRELKKENDATRKSMVELEKQGKKGSQEWKNLKSAIDSNNRTMADNRAKMEAITKQMSSADMTLNQLNKRLRELTKEFNNTSKATDPKRYKELQQQIDRTRKAIDEAKNSTHGLAGAFSSINKMQEVVKGFFLGIGNSILTNITGAFRNAFGIIVDFEKENARLAAILGTSEEGIKDLTKAARELGSTTSYSAAEVTQLQIELAKLGFQREQIIAMEGAVLKFAKAVGTDLASASAFAGAALRIFGKDASDTETVLASFAVATTKTALDFSKLETALATVGPVAAAAGFSLEDTTALLGQLANAGFDASSAATATRNIILKMVDPAGDLAKALGGPARNADELAAGFQRLQAAGVDLATALELSDKRSVAAFQTFIEQSGSLVELRDSITGVNDQFNAMADTMGDNVAGAMAGLKSATEELILRIADGTEGSIKALIKALTTVVGWLQKGVTWIKENSRWIKTVVATLVTLKVTIMAVNTVQKIWLALVKASGAELAGLTRVQKLHAVSTGLMSTATKGATASLKALWATMIANPITAIITAVTTLVSAILVWKSSTEEMSEVERKAAENAEAHAKKREDLEVAIESEKKRLQELHNVAKDELADHDERIKAIAALNQAIPEYNGHIDETTGALKANTDALKDNIREMEKRMRLAYYKDEYQQYLNEQTAAEFQWERARRARRQFLEEEAVIIDGVIKPRDETLRKIIEGKGSLSENWNYSEALRAWQKKNKDTENNKSAANQALKDANAGHKDFILDMEAMGVSLADLAGEDSDTTFGGGGGVTLPDKDKNKGRGKDKIKEATAAIDAEHQQNLAAIERMKESMTDAQYIIEKNQEMIDYCGQLTEALSDLQSKTADTDTELLNKITERQGKIDQEAAKAQHNINTAIHLQEEKFHSEFLASKEAFYEEQQRRMQEAVQKQEITQGAADIFLMNEEMAMHKEQLKRLRDYYDQVEKADYLSDEKRKERLSSLTTEIKAMQSKVLTDTGNFTAKLREMMENPVGPAALKKSYEARRLEIAQAYEEMKKTVTRDSEDFVKLEEEKNRRLLVLDVQHQEELLKLQENVGLSWADEYNLELLRLKEMHAEGIITEEEYQRKRLEIGVANAKKYFDFYSGLATSMFQAIQDAEIASSDAKYDALIRQAENNGEDTARLEEEKENKKLEIQKKYADVNFAIKVSQIIADTAVSIMKAFADLGPIGGAVAAAMLTATGAAQVVMANAEREKIKNLQPKSSASASGNMNPATASRVLSGFSEGGYTGDGGRYEVAGVVHKGEYVVPMPIMNNPRVVDAVGTIEAIRLNRRGTMQSYAGGGYTSAAGRGYKTNVDSFTPELAGEMKSMINEMREIFRNVKAYVVLQDLEKKQKQLDRARAPFTR